MCCICFQGEETNDHLFVACPRVQDLWHGFMNLTKIQWTCPGSLQDLEKEWCSLGTTVDDKVWGLIPFALVWSIWVARNTHIFRGTRINLVEVWDMALTRVAWWVKNLWPSCPYDTYQIVRNLGEIKFPSPRHKERVVVWTPPDIGFLKVNVDGASKGNPGPSGIGGLIRNSNRKILGYFALNTGFGWAYEAEVRAIQHALIFCHQYLFRNIIIESDCTMAVGWVQSIETRPWRLISELNQIDMLMKEINCREIRNIYKESNFIADFLANKGCERLTPVWTLEEDSNGIVEADLLE